MNAVLLERVAGGWSLGGVNVGHAFVVIALVSEGALLFVAAQAGFIDGPRVMANMAVDSWLPHRFAALSERLTMRNGILLMGGTALAALVYTRGDVSKLVVMYSINVFVTFSLSNIAMTVFWFRRRREDPSWARHLPAHVAAAAPCVLILVVTVIEKFMEGGWLTLRDHRRADRLLLRGPPALPRRRRARCAGSTHQIPAPAARPELYPCRPDDERRELDRERARSPSCSWAATAGSGRHALLTLLRMFPGHFQGVVFVSVAVVDSDVFKGAEEIPALEERTRAQPRRIRTFRDARSGCPRPAPTPSAPRSRSRPSSSRSAWCSGTRRWSWSPARSSSRRTRSGTALLHNQTALVIQRRLQQRGRADDRDARRAGPARQAERARAFPGARLLAEVTGRSRTGETDRAADAFLMPTRF